MIVISKWYGRLGNNIIQVLNAILLAYELQDNITMPVHQYFNSTEINLFLEPQTQMYKGIFYFAHKIRCCNNTIFKFNTNTDNFIKAVNKLKEFFIPYINNLKNDKNLTNVNTKNNSKPDIKNIIHIRSGDIFDKKHHPKYIQPPISFYNNLNTNILEHNAFKSYEIISQNISNPILPLLKDKYKLKYEESNLETDINKIINARAIIGSVGTFIPTLALFNDTLKDLYIPINITSTNFYSKFIDYYKYMGINIHLIECTKYTLESNLQNHIKYLLES